MAEIDLQSIAEQLQVLQALVESDHNARVSHADSILELRQAANRLEGWMRALDFDGRGVILQEDTPPILRLMATLAEDNRLLRLQNATLIAQNAHLIGDPIDVEAEGANSQASASLPSLAAHIALISRALGNVQRNQVAIAGGLVLVFFMVLAHQYFMAAQLGAGFVGGR